MYTNKRGVGTLMMWSAFAVMCIIVVVVLVQGIYGGITSIFEKNECKISVQEHSFASSTVGELSKFMADNIKCKTKYKKLPSGESAIKENLAKEMLLCWDTFGKGKLKLFQSTEGSFCHICTQIDFKGIGETISGNDFMKYLSENPSGESYLEKMQPFVSQHMSMFQDQIDQGDVKYPDIDTSKKYAVIYKHLKGREVILQEFDSENADDFDALAVGMLAAVPGAQIGASAGGMACSWSGPGAALCSVVGGALGGVVYAALAIHLYVSVDVNDQAAAYTAILPYDEESMQKLGCNIFPVSQS